MKMLELFCGTKSMSNAFKRAGHEVFTVDWNKNFEPDLCADISKVQVEDLIKLCGGKVDVIHASPDCTSYSVAAIGYHRKKDDNGNLLPKTDYAKFCDTTNCHVLNLIQNMNPKYFFIENPVGGLRKMDFMQHLHRYTVTYCQYGDFRQKPTDIWTNHPYPMFKLPCKRGASCHESAPRGSRTGTQKLNGSKDRSRIPDLFCDHIVKICEMTDDEIKKAMNGEFLF